MTENELRMKVCDTARSFLGCKESDGSHRKIIDIYNAHSPLARGYKMSYTDDWCACFVSVISILCGLTEIMPKEVGCNQMIQLYKDLGSWVEADDYIPEPGDVIFFDWEDNGIGDNIGGANHVGLVDSCDGKSVKTMEGNYGDAVKSRTLFVNGKYIRGYGVPKYSKLATKPIEPPAPETPKIEDETGDEKVSLENMVADLMKRVNALETKSKVYNSVNELPDWATEARRMVEAGIIKGDGKNLNITQDLARALEFLKRDRELNN